MATLLIALIFLIFVHLGLPVSLLGAAWPILHVDLGFPVAWAGILATMIALGRITASLAYEPLGRRISTGVLTATSMLVMAGSLSAFSLSTRFPLLCLWSLTFGLGAGLIDAAINHYVTLHYRARQLNWLHLSFSLGGTIGPYLMGFALARGMNWTGGYQIIAILQFAILGLLLLSLPIWLRYAKTATFTRLSAPAILRDQPLVPERGLRSLLRLRGLREVLLGFFCFAAVEASIFVWASTWLVEQRGIAPESAARLAALYSLGVTAGRFLAGFIADAVGSRRMIRFGSVCIGVGIILTLLPGASDARAMVGLVTIGLGAAPIFPSVIHSVPRNFGSENAQAVIGVHFASASAGALVIPPLFGLLADGFGMQIFPAFLFVFFVLMVLLMERLNRLLA